MSNIDEDEIVRLAALMHKVDHGGSEDDAAEYKRGLDQLSAVETMLVIFAGKLMEGKPYRIASDNPQNVARYRSVARHLGATEETEQSGWKPGITQLLFRPPARQ